MRPKIESALLGASIPPDLVKALLDAYAEIKEHFFFGRFRPAELEGGRFSEAAIRVVQQMATGSHSPLNRPLSKFEDILKSLAALPPASAHDSLRLHIPRSLWAVYNVRNRRNVGHVGGDVDPNRADAHFVMASCDWALAELLRLTFNCQLTEAQALVDALVERRIPLIQDINGFPKLLNPGLSAPDKILVHLFVRGSQGASVAEIKSWLKTTKSQTIATALSRLEHDAAYVHRSQAEVFITSSGIRYVEQNINMTF
jgi:hypothetical protein